MKKFMALMLSVVMTLCLLAGCGTKTESKNFRIVTTIYPVYNWLQNITEGAENIELTLLLEDGKDIHNYQPTAEDMVKISECNYFVYVGGESDQWVNDAADAYFKDNDGKYKVSLLDLLGDYAKDEEEVEGMQADDDEDEDEGALDEHVWLSIKNAELFCRELAAGLKTANAGNAAVYEKNEKTYQQNLKTLDEKYTDALTKSEKKYDTLLFADRFPFRYLVDDYDLKYYAAFAGCSADSEASFETVAFLANKLKELDLPAVLTIDGSDNKLAETIISTSENKDAQILQLNSMQAVTKEMIDSDNDYVGMMESNLAVLKSALAAEG